MTMSTRLQVVIDLHIKDSNHKTEIVSQLMPATKKFEESFNCRASAELTQIVIPTEKEVKLDSTIIHEGVSLDLVSRQVKVRDQEINLTPLEFKLLALLIERRGQVQGRKLLLREVWNSNPQNNTRTVDVHIKRLRDKLGTMGCLIQTVSGMGYIIRSTQP
jgi:DNA-binding response OmpR family regulator